MIGLLVFALLISSVAIARSLYEFFTKENKEESFMWFLAHSAVFSFNVMNLINIIKLENF